jgi:hypothetical protein
MINRKLRAMLLALSLASAPFMKVSPFTWAPVGDAVDAQGYATTSGVYHKGFNFGGNGGDYIDENPQVANSSMSTDDSDVLYIDGNLRLPGAPDNGGADDGLTAGDPDGLPDAYSAGPTPCSLKVDGDVRVEATTGDLDIYMLSDVTFEPYSNNAGVTATFGNLGVNAGTDGTEYAQLYFNAGEGSTITFHVTNNLFFKGRTVDSETADYTDMIVTFAGSGKTVFKLADGTIVSFDGQVDDTTPITVSIDEEGNLVEDLPLDINDEPHCNFSSNAAGTKVFITMDQTFDQVDCGQHKVTFQRMTEAEHAEEEGEFDPSLRSMVYVGVNSLITYLSDNDSGFEDDENSCTGGYGSLAFDPSIVGDAEDVSGRLVLMIKGAYDIDLDEVSDTYGQMIAKYPFNDGAVIIAGHHVDYNEDEGCYSFEPDNIRDTLDYSTPAGVQALFVVKDNVAYENDENEEYDPTVDDRKGLLVINDCANHGKLASDPYWDLYNDTDTYTGPSYAYSNPDNSEFNVRRGFVLGVNGQIDVYHHTFLDYVAGSYNQIDKMTECDFDDLCSVKSRNPSALIVDGLDARLFYDSDGGPFVANPFTEELSLFEAANPFTNAVQDVRKAEIKLRGTGAVYFRSSVSTRDGYMYNYWFGTDFDTDNYDDVYLDPAVDYLYSLANGDFDEDGYPTTVTYNGLQLDLNEQTNDDTIAGQIEGHHVLDVEGALDVYSVANTTETDDAYLTSDGSECDSRAFATEVDQAGMLEMYSVLRDYTGRELDFNEDYTNRPVFADGTIDGLGEEGYRGVPLVIDDQDYVRYNSPGMFFNNFMSLFGANLMHSDATKYVDGTPGNSDPAMTGGERLYFVSDEAGFIPEFSDDSEEVLLQDTDPDRYRTPEIRLFNSTVHLHDSLNSSGVRWVVMDIPGADGSDEDHELEDNTSYIRFSDQGDSHQTLPFNHIRTWGQIFLMSSLNNTMADPECSNFATEGTFFNIFRHTAPTEAGYANIELILQNNDQFDEDVPTDFYDLQRAHHLFIMGIPENGTCNTKIGWEDIYGDSVFFPYDDQFSDNEEDYFTNDILTDNDEFAASPATMTIDGKVICIGAFDANGDPARVPAVSSDDDGVLYVNHGGKLTITPKVVTTSELRDINPSQAVIDTIIAQRIWNDYDFDGINRVVQLTGCVDLPHDQVTFSHRYSVQPYNFTTEMFDARREDNTLPDGSDDPGTGGFVRLSFENAARGPLRSLRYPCVDRSGGEEVSVGWFYRDFEGNDNSIPVKSSIHKFLTKATESLGGPVDRPIDLLYVGAGDDITQFRVAGATLSDPFALDVAGDLNRPVVGRVREFTTLKTTADLITEHFIGEGAHAALFVEAGGRIGLGSRSWNEHSINAWNLLGKDYVSICPLGDGVIDVNSNLLVADRLPLICTTSFGVDPEDEENEDFAQRITFYSDQPREIRVPACGELDLSSFGQASGRQEIAFGGNVRLVIEEGATIRFPDFDAVNGGVVLYFNDNAQLIFEGAENNALRRPYYSDEAPADDARAKLVGTGQIWFNKNAQMRVDGNALVGVQTDDLTNTTEIIISLQRQSAFYIGDDNVPGGSFEVGNPCDRGEDHYVAFELILNGPRALMHTDREGFFGLGAGILNKQGVINGDADVSNNPNILGDGTAQIISGVPVFNPDTTNAWQVHRLFNTYFAGIEIKQGIIEHNNIADGSSKDASLWAIGPVLDVFFLDINDKENAVVRGGGNLMFVPEADTESGDAVTFANVWDYAGFVANGEAYSVLGSGPLLLDRAAEFSATAYENGAEFVVSNDIFGSASFHFFNLLSSKPINEQARPKVAVGRTQFDDRAALTSSVTGRKYAVGSIIDRFDAPSITGVGNADYEDIRELGALGVTTDNTGDPISYFIIN